MTQDYQPDSGSSDAVSKVRQKGIYRMPSRRMAIRGVVGAGALVIMLAIGIHYYIKAMYHESSDDAFIDSRIVVISPRVSAHVVQVHVRDNQPVKAGDLLVSLDSRDFQARLDAAKAALEAARSARKSQDINVKLTTITATSQVSEAEANVKTAQAMLEAAKAQAAASLSQRDQASAQRAYARASLDLATAEAAAVAVRQQRDAADMKRSQEMAAQQTVSRQQLDHATATAQMSAADLDAAHKKVQAQEALVQQSEAALKAAEDNVLQARAQIAVRQGQLEQAMARLTSAKSAPHKMAQSSSRAQVSAADVEKAKAEEEQAALMLSYTKIYAPEDGFVTRKGVEPGSFVQVGQSLMAIVTPDIWVTANFKETQLTRMHAEQPVEISVDTYPGVVFKGHVDSIQHGSGARFSLLPPENATGNYVKVVQRIPVKIMFDQMDMVRKYRLSPGMSVVPEVNIRAGKSSQAPLSENAKHPPSSRSAGAPPASRP